MDLEILKPGSQVMVGGSHPAKILSVHIAHGPSVTYTVSWWSGTNRCEQELSPFEIGVLPKENMRIGFAEPQ